MAEMMVMGTIDVDEYMYTDERRRYESGYMWI